MKMHPVPIPPSTLERILRIIKGVISHSCSGLMTMRADEDRKKVETKTRFLPIDTMYLPRRMEVIRVARGLILNIIPISQRGAPLDRARSG